MKPSGWPVIVALLTLAIQGCTQRVQVPPRIDLKQHEIIGVIDFECSGRDQLGPSLTRRFVDAVRRDQGVVRIAMLGKQADVLAAIGHAHLDPDAIKEIGRKHQVNTLFTGDLVVSDVKPSIEAGQTFTYIGVSADVDATLAVQMVETETGASLWSASAHDVQRIGGLEVFGDKSFTVDADDPENAYARLATNLVHAVTHDFRSRWIRVRKK